MLKFDFNDFYGLWAYRDAHQYPVFGLQKEGPDVHLFLMHAVNHRDGDISTSRGCIRSGSIFFTATNVAD